jgi:pimeloyl-ACP methyl ester carboxylesterase
MYLFRIRKDRIFQHIAFVMALLSWSLCRHKERTCHAADDLDRSSPDATQYKARLPNIPMQTFGGLQWWTDYAYRNGYRIQRNALTNHWRLLDARDIRYAWGTREHCEAVLKKTLDESASKASPDHCVVLVHGLMRTRNSMQPLEEVNLCGSEIILFSYASSRDSIGKHAEALREFLESLPAQQTISFVGHSMGNIVVRHLIADLSTDEKGKALLSRFKKMVMLGPPNQGAAIARRFASLGLLEVVAGRGAMELGPEWGTLMQKLAVPPFPFMIIAGELGEKSIQNPLLKNESDFVVEVDEAKLDGSDVFKTVPVLHSFLMQDAAVQKMVAEYVCEPENKK